MRSAFRRSLLVPALLLVSSFARAGIEREIVFCSARRATVATESALHSRLASLGIVESRSLLAGLDVRSSEAAATGPFDLDPARVWLAVAADAAAAEAAARALARDPAIEWVEPNRVREPASIWPDDPLFRDGRQWGLEHRTADGLAGPDVRAREAWGSSTGSAAVRLAVADTGIDLDHPELAFPLPGGGPRIERAVDVTGDTDRTARDRVGHGTAVAGVMAARTGDGAHFDSLGIAGVCGGDGRANPGCRLVPIKITSGISTGASSFDIARAILYAAETGARAMNLSFAGSGPSRLERLALHHALTHGCVVVAASGNRGASAGEAPQYPAAYAAEGLCVQVGASDRDDRRAGFSSHGPGLDLVAPGVDIWTTYLTYPSAAGVSYPGYVAASGTSLAAPFVTGAIGLLAARRPELDACDFRNVLRASAHDVGVPGTDAETGAGRLDLARALASVGPEVGVWHDETAAQSFEVRARGTLHIVEAEGGALGATREWPGADLVEAGATVAIPDSFLGPVSVWPRVTGTTTVRGGFSLPYFTPWSEVATQEATSFTLRGYLYRAPACEDCAATELPLPADQARFGFTVAGLVDRAPRLHMKEPPEPPIVRGCDTIRVAWEAHDPDAITSFEIWLDPEFGAPVRLAELPGNDREWRGPVPCLHPGGKAAIRLVAEDRNGRHHDRSETSMRVTLEPARAPVRPSVALAAAPNPFRESIRIVRPPDAAIRIVDVEGRTVRRSAADGSVAFIWNGRDDRGHRVAPGLYFVHAEDFSSHALRILRLE